MAAMTNAKKFKLLGNAALVAAGSFVAALQADGFADEFGGFAFVVAGGLGIAGEAIEKAEEEEDK